VTRNRSLNNQAIKRLVADGRAPNDPDLERYPDAAPPDQTISDYFYGDHLHWDSKADVVEERERSPFLDVFSATSSSRLRPGVTSIRRIRDARRDGDRGSGVSVGPRARTSGTYLPREVFFGRLGFPGAFVPVCVGDFGRFFPATSGSFRLMCSG
jgi:hypothetical protein